MTIPTSTPDPRLTGGAVESYLAATAANENQALIDVAVASTDLTPLEPGTIHAVAVPAGGRVELIDLDKDEYRATPRRTEGRYTVRTAESLLTYLDKHALPETELWADIDSSSITAVIDAHRGADEAPGWQAHRATLQLQLTDEWKLWTGIDGKLQRQVEFAEFIEQRTVDFVTPDGATILELAQSFQATRSGRFESSKRLASGETSLIYKDEVSATAGRSGQIDIPDVVELALAPFVGHDRFRVTARFRFRLDGGALLLGFALERPRDVLQAAFNSVVETVNVNQSAPIYIGPAPR